MRKVPFDPSRDTAAEVAAATVKTIKRKQQRRSSPSPLVSVPADVLAKTAIHNASTTTTRTPCRYETPASDPASNGERGGWGCRWSAEEDDALLRGVVRLGIKPAQRITPRQWEEITEDVSTVRFRLQRQVRRRWNEYLNPAGIQRHKATRSRRYESAKLRRAVNRELKQLSSSLDCDNDDALAMGPTWPSHELLPGRAVKGADSPLLSEDAVHDMMTDLVLDEDSRSTLALSAIEPPLDSSPPSPLPTRLEVLVADNDDDPKMRRRGPSEPEINYSSMVKPELCTPATTPTTTATATADTGTKALTTVCTYRFGWGLGRARSLSFSFAPYGSGCTSMRGRGTVVVLAAPVAPAAEPQPELQQQQQQQPEPRAQQQQQQHTITNYMRQSKRAVPRDSALHRETKPPASTTDKDAGWWPLSAAAALS